MKKKEAARLELNKKRQDSYDKYCEVMDKLNDSNIKYRNIIKAKKKLAKLKNKRSDKKVNSRHNKTKENKKNNNTINNTNKKSINDKKDVNQKMALDKEVKEKKVKASLIPLPSNRFGFIEFSKTAISSMLYSKDIKYVLQKYLKNELDHFKYFNHYFNNEKMIKKLRFRSENLSTDLFLHRWTCCKFRIGKDFRVETKEIKQN